MFEKDIKNSAVPIIVINSKVIKMVPRARIELALPKKPDFESGASTNSATPALKYR